MGYTKQSKINKLLRHPLRVFFVGFLHLTRFFYKNKNVEKNLKTLENVKKRFVSMRIIAAD